MLLDGLSGRWREEDFHREWAVARHAAKGHAVPRLSRTRFRRCHQWPRRTRHSAPLPGRHCWVQPRFKSATRVDALDPCGCVHRLGTARKPAPDLTRNTGRARMLPSTFVSRHRCNNGRTPRSLRRPRGQTPSCTSLVAALERSRCLHPCRIAVLLRPRSLSCTSHLRPTGMLLSRRTANPPLRLPVHLNKILLRCPPRAE